MRYYKGYAKTPTGDPEGFEFEVADDATEEDIDGEMIAAMWESGVIDVWYEKVKLDG